MHDVFYISDSIDFPKALFEAKKSVLKRKLILYTSTLTSLFYGLDTVLSSLKVHFAEKNVKSCFEVVKDAILFDPFIRVLAICVFYDIPVIIARMSILFTLQSSSAENYIFILRNAISFFMTISIYTETLQNDNFNYYYSSF